MNRKKIFGVLAITLFLYLNYCIFIYRMEVKSFVSSDFGLFFTIFTVPLFFIFLYKFLKWCFK